MFGGVGGDTDKCQVRTTLRGRTRARVRTRPTSLSQNQTAASSQNPAMFHFGGPEALEWNIAAAMFQFGVGDHASWNIVVGVLVTNEPESESNRSVESEPCDVPSRRSRGA